MASSTVSFSGTTAARAGRPSSAVMMTFGCRPRDDLAATRVENPEKTVLKRAPIRKQARTATMASDRFGVKIATASPFLTPRPFSTLAHLFTSTTSIR